jgi:hypothetical protein
MTQLENNAAGTKQARVAELERELERKSKVLQYHHQGGRHLTEKELAVVQNDISSLKRKLEFTKNAPAGTLISDMKPDARDKNWHAERVTEGGGTSRRLQEMEATIDGLHKTIAQHKAGVVKLSDEEFKATYDKLVAYERKFNSLTKM